MARTAETTSKLLLEMYKLQVTKRTQNKLIESPSYVRPSWCVLFRLTLSLSASRSLPFSIHPLFSSGSGYPCRHSWISSTSTTASSTLDLTRWHRSRTTIWWLTRAGINSCHREWTTPVRFHDSHQWRDIAERESRESDRMLFTPLQN